MILVSVINTYSYYPKGYALNWVFVLKVVDNCYYLDVKVFFFNVKLLKMLTCNIQQQLIRKNKIIHAVVGTTKNVPAIQCSFKCRAKCVAVTPYFFAYSQAGIIFPK